MNSEDPGITTAPELSPNEEGFYTMREVGAICCPVHGEHNHVMHLSVDGAAIGTYCFECYNDFLSKNLTNFAE